MKKLLIIRHAKSDWTNPLLDDHARPLADRGLTDAPRMAQRLKKRGVFPDAVLSSDAQRAKATALITAENLKFPKEKIRLSSTLYHATARTILAEIKKTSSTVETLFVFGHNPGLNDLIADLGCKIDNLPTSGQVGFTFETETWMDINRKNAVMWFFDYPKLS